MILRSVGIAGAIVVGLAVAVRADAAAGDPRDPRRARSTAFAIRDGARRRPATEGAVGAPRPPGHAPSRRGPRPDAARSCSSSARRSCTSGSTRPTRRSCRRRVPSRAAFDRLAARLRRGRVRAARRSPIRTTGAGDRARPTSRRSTTTRAASRPTRAITRVDSLVDVDPRLTLGQYQLLYGDPNGPRDRYRRRRPSRATTKGDLTAFTVYTPYGPNRDEGQALVADLRDPERPARAAGRA